MKKIRKSSKVKRNYYVDIASLFPFIILLFSGIIMLSYHGGKPYSESVFALNGNSWLNIHIVSAIVSFITITIHLILHKEWFKKLFSKDKKNKYWIRNFLLFIVFLATVLTSIIPPFFIDNSELSTLILGLHNKFGLLLILFFIIHLLTYFKWIINMTSVASAQ